MTTKNNPHNPSSSTPSLPHSNGGKRKEGGNLKEGGSLVKGGTSHSAAIPPSPIRLGIIGHGIIGQAITAYLSAHNPSVQLFISDPPKGHIADLANTPDLAAVFIQIHLPTLQDGSQPLSRLIPIIAPLPPSVPVFVRTTILPGSSEALSKATAHSVAFLPEFLSEKTALKDFSSQPLAFPSPHQDLLHRIFPDKPYIVASPLELELAKYAHNTFGALKVTFFNAVNHLCSQLSEIHPDSPPLSYHAVLSAILLSSYINQTHTKVPGPDSHYGYGGKCFPKDVNAFLRFARSINAPIANLLSPLPTLNNFFRAIPPPQPNET